VAEWTADSVNCDGSGCLFAGFRYTISGFVNALTSQGVPIPPFAGSGVGAFGKDYVALPPTLSGSYAVVRGGDSSGGERSGVHSVNLAITESDSGANVGFRCVIR
ncbi:MAG: hypothetical protein HY436_00355, partial [Candidatus Liptonbacteria bacterium]|nr:hypothetical protein [Candidatus Liptonbacteria bacterium]